MAKKKDDGVDVYESVAMNRIDPPSGQVRMEIPKESIGELAENIREQGLFNPILLVLVNGRYEIVQGHRRYLAFVNLGRKEIAAKIVKMDEVTVALARGSENLQREELSPIEEGAIYQDLQDRFNMKYEQISKRMGKSPHVVKRRMDLMRMPTVLQKAIHEKLISASVGEELWRLREEAAIDYYLSFAIDNGATKEVVRDWVKEHQSKLRAEARAGDMDRSPRSPMEPLPTYVPCDVCKGAMEIGTEMVIRACKECGQKILEALK